MTVAAVKPMEFWELRESIRAEQAQVEQLYARSGRLIRGGSRSPMYMQRLAEATDFLAGIYEGRIPAHRLQEAMSTSDFPLLMGDILDRQLLANYREWPAVWRAFARQGTVRDFRQARRIAMDGLEGGYYPDYLKPEQTAVKQSDDLAETGYLTQVQVYEKAFGINWRMLINDDLDAFRDLPARLARGARRTESRFATQLYVDANGPHASLYTAGNANIVTGNPALSITGLQTAMQVLAAMVDANGEPIFIDVVVLVVPPALEITAQNIINATEITIDPNAAAGTAQQQLKAQNWMRNRVRLVVDPYIPIVATAANGNTSWFLFADPNVGRPALEVTFLRGYEEPALFQKAPNTQRVGGGLEPALGDFDSNEIRYKGMHIIGGTRLDPKASVASNGSGA
ncbi:MAG: hypothetical protein C4551_10120 [Bacillota bacterium]|jgi:hypothetical protein|nr:MAG: hypothetical protein C4551_10120 [Bacillota bacterium]